MNWTAREIELANMERPVMRWSPALVAKLAKVEEGHWLELMPLLTQWRQT